MSIKNGAGPPEGKTSIENSITSNGHLAEKLQERRESEAKHFVRTFLRHFLRGCCKGVCVHTGLGVLSALLRNPSWKSLHHVWKSVRSCACLQLAVFFGLFPSVYHATVHLLARLRRKRDGWTYSLSGAIAGLSIAVLDYKSRWTLVFYTVSRGLSAAVLTLVDRGCLPYVPLFDVATFVVCSSMLVYCTALHPEYLTPSYYRSIVNWSKDYNDKNLTFLFRTPASRFLTCQEGGLHTGQCVTHLVADFVQSLPRFAKIYLPIHLAPILLFRRKLVKERPLHVASAFLHNMATSTAFLGVMVTIAKFTICLLRNRVHVPPPLPDYIPVVAGALCSLAVFIERRSRRTELVQFVVPNTLNILYTFCRRTKLGSKMRVPHGFTLVFSLTMMSLMHAYELQPDSLTKLTTGIVRFFVGNPHGQPPVMANGDK